MVKKRKVLIVDDCLRLWKEMAVEFETDIDKRFISDNEKEDLEKAGFVKLEKDDTEVYITGEVKTTIELIERGNFDIYFLDNQIYDSRISKKILGQSKLIELIKNKNNNVLPLIYNISSDKNTDYLSTCSKNGKDIMNLIITTKGSKKSLTSN